MLIVKLILEYKRENGNFAGEYSGLEMEHHKESGFAIGRHIKAVLEEEGRSVTWLADQMGCSREYLYRVFSRTWIGTDLLVRISEAMQHDFFRDYSRTLRYKRKRS